MKVISFTKVALPYGWMGNMSPHIVRFNGKAFKTSEHLFQCLRFAAFPEVFDEISVQQSPMGAKMKAKKHKHLIVSTLGQADVARMVACVKLKVGQHPDLARFLRGTGDATLIEDCTARPGGTGLFWGAALQSDGTWKGDNVLGKIWMDLRDELKQMPGQGNQVPMAWSQGPVQ